MATDNRSAAEIEREIETERAELKETLSDIQESFSADAIMRQVTDQFREHGGEISRSVARSVRDNPIALGLTGIGLAWMIFGDGPGRARSRWDDDRFPEGSRHAAMGRGDPRDPVPAGSGPNWTEPRHLERGSKASGDTETVYAGTTAGSTMPTPASRYSSSPAQHGSETHGRGWGESASDAMHGAGSSVRDTASGMRDGISSRAHRAGDGISRRWASARSGVSARAEATRVHAADLRSRISHGTEQMSEEARRRVIAAREQAIHAREQAADAMSRGADKAADVYEEHPLVVGALAVAVGAAIAGALPRTRTEDEYFGHYSDDLYHEAERVYAEERSKIEKVASSAASEAKKAARDLKDELDSNAPEGKTAADSAADSLREKSRNVAGAAETKAKEEDLGNPRT
ncbi:DUF3618 domain-containing protein [Profundibacterium mesophilum]|uniref:DUF3618 domain-containing protein n=1 Tax=Profundibacterium mesophilum KAUST100406-0324 TaxID=1037889 RepID=A0A921NQL6_9RHOB|nr:DUF3618 domain-containing protein [Profundibacterium mesophilum]KAF0675467.1 hypothetical protein PMES_02358 [Profundibacterium mesophilum KAUST100406-0324]